MTKSSSRISLKTVGLLLLLSGVFVALSSGAAQATGVGPTDIEVKKTATVTGTVVSGVITIKNKGRNLAAISSVVDTLEVRFPGRVTPPPLPPGSHDKWFQVALVPGLQAMPNPIPVGATVTINYSFDTCDASDYTGAEKMRNVVSVTLINGPHGSKTVTKHSDDFEPPSQENCPFCGDGTVNQSTEQCDGTDLDGQTCVTQGFGSGTLACTSSCTFDTSGCSLCGNGVVDSGEDCDGTDLNGQTCVTRGFVSGTLACTSSCTFNTSGCSLCGNGVVNPPELCDGPNLNGQTCVSLGQGFSGGILRCTAACTFDTSGCIRE